MDAQTLTPTGSAALDDLKKRALEQQRADAAESTAERAAYEARRGAAWMAVKNQITALIPDLAPFAEITISREFIDSPAWSHKALAKIAIPEHAPIVMSFDTKPDTSKDRNAFGEPAAYAVGIHSDNREQTYFVTTYAKRYNPHSGNHVIDTDTAGFKDLGAALLEAEEQFRAAQQFAAEIDAETAERNARVAASPLAPEEEPPSLGQQLHDLIVEIVRETNGYN